MIADTIKRTVRKFNRKGLSNSILRSTVDGITDPSNNVANGTEQHPPVKIAGIIPRNPAGRPIF
jgi:hypothetical protein